MFLSSPKAMCLRRDVCLWHVAVSLRVRLPRIQKQPRLRLFFVNDEQKGASFYGESGASVHGGDTTKRQIGNYIYLDIQTVDNKTPIWYYLIKLLYRSFFYENEWWISCH